MPTTVTTPEECLRYVESVELCTWRHQPKLAWLPSLERVTMWQGGELTRQTWFWKDDLHIERRLYFGMLIAPDIPVFVALSLLPSLIAAQGDIDARTLHEKGLLASNALRVFEHVEGAGPTATAALPWPSGSRMLYLAALQQKFLLTKYDLTGRTRRTYGYRWCLCENAFPDSFTEASRLSVSVARERILSHLNQHGADITMERVARLFRWQPI
jgi:hypothetical protein